MLNLTLVISLLTLACGDDSDGTDSAADGGAASDGGTADGGTTSDGGATSDGGSDAGSSDGGGADGGGVDSGGADGGAEGYGVCSLVSATLDDYTMELDWGMQLNRIMVDPAKGESCGNSVWVDNYGYGSRLVLSVYFQASTLADLDGTTTTLDWTSLWTKDDEDHWAHILNNWEGNEQGLVLVDHPEVPWAYMDGEVTWTEVDSSTARLVFTTLCWPDNPYRGDPEPFSCQSFEAAWLEFNCEYTSAKAGPVGVSSWVTGADGDTLCTLPD